MVYISYHLVSPTAFSINTHNTHNIERGRELALGILLPRAVPFRLTQFSIISILNNLVF